MRHSVPGRDSGSLCRKRETQAAQWVTGGRTPCPIPGARTRSLPTHRKFMAMRTRSTLFLVLCSAALALGAAACDGDPAGPPKRGSGDLVFIRQGEDAPPLQTTQVSFWVTQDDGGEAEIRYANGRDCLEFDVPNDALQSLNGVSFGEEDSVRITIRVVDLERYVFEFLPAGLKFRANREAELRVSYDYADPDYNDDGVIDGDDVDYDFGFWRQEAGETRWTRIGTAQLKDLEELRADIRGFSKYAVAGE